MHLHLTQLVSDPTWHVNSLPNKPICVLTFLSKNVEKGDWGTVYICLTFTLISIFTSTSTQGQGDENGAKRARGEDADEESSSEDSVTL